MPQAPTAPFPLYPSLLCILYTWNLSKYGLPLALVKSQANYEVKTLIVKTLAPQLHEKRHLSASSSVTSFRLSRPVVPRVD